MSVASSGCGELRLLHRRELRPVPWTSISMSKKREAVHSWLGLPGPRLCGIRLASPGPVSKGNRSSEKSHAPKMSHVISLGQFSTRLENVGIATVRFQSLNNREGNYVRHLWGTMRVYGELCGCAAHLSGAPRVRGVPLLPRPRRGFADGEDRAEGLVLRGRVGAG